MAMRMFNGKGLMVFFTFHILDISYNIHQINGKEVSFDYAKNECEKIGQQLPIISTNEEYGAVLKRISSGTSPWLDTYWNDILKTFQWGNGKIVSVSKWAGDEPKGFECVYFRKGLWYTTDCSNSYNYICSTGRNDLNITNYGQDLVTFQTAVERCGMQGKRLPVIQSDVEVMISLTIVNNVWLGMYKSGNWYRWITGEEVSLLKSRDSDYGAGHLHVHLDDDRLILHEDSNDQAYFCQNKSAIEDTFTLSNQYALKITTVRLQGPHLRKLTTHRRTQCAVECSKSDSCFKYTRVGPICTLYGDVPFQFDSSSDESLWERSKIHQRA